MTYAKTDDKNYKKSLVEPPCELSNEKSVLLWNFFHEPFSIAWYVFWKIIFNYLISVSKRLTVENTVFWRGHRKGSLITASVEAVKQRRTSYLSKHACTSFYEKQIPWTLQVITTWINISVIYLENILSQRAQCIYYKTVFLCSEETRCVPKILQ